MPEFDSAVLDNPVWHSLTTTHAPLAEGDGPARRFRPDVAGFVGIERDHPDAWQALAKILGPAQTVTLALTLHEGPPSTWTRVASGRGRQMIADSLVAPSPTAREIRTLDDDHVPQMLALVDLTKPGPFRPRTIELGNYYGVFESDQLIAMAGERLQTPEFVEVSAVCTHPSARGCGLAAALTHHVAQQILTRGKTPILHVAEANVTAQRVYERLGFAVRKRIEFSTFTSP
ncbi:MAG: GNAT family N-acetyltransferase [Acidimicrobiales bacterium]